MQRIAPYILLLLALLAVILVYRPGLSGPFVFDDGLNIVNNEHLRLHELTPESLREAAYSVPSGLLNRPISMLSFALNFYSLSNNFTPFPFKLTNLIIHLLNGIVVFVLTRLIVGVYCKRREPGLSSAYPDWLALAVSAAWLLHPLNLTSVLYVVQRMTSLSALFTFVGLIVYVWGRVRLLSGHHGGMVAIVAGLLIFTPLAALSKENGVLLPFFMLIIELTLFRFETPSLAARRRLIIFFVVCVALPVLFFITYVIQHPDWVLGGYVSRDFTLAERLMTEARILWFYLRLIVLPSTALMGMYHDDIGISHQLFDPGTTLFAILGILALPICAWLMWRRMPLIAFGILFFIVGHSIESSFISLELAHEHRNYLPMYGVLLAFFHLLLAPLQTDSAQLLRRSVAVLLIGLFAVGTLSRANAWANPFDLWHAEVEHHPNSPRANSELGDLYAHYTTVDPLITETHYLFAKHYYERAVALQKNNVNGLFGLIQLGIAHDKPVEKYWLAELAYRLGHEAMPANINDQLIILAACRMQKDCPLTDQEIESLLHEPLQNPKITGNAKALAYAPLIFYLVNVARDYPAAIDAMNRSIELAPHELEHRLTLVKFLIAIGHRDEARDQLAILHQADRQHIRTRDITLLGKELAQGD